MANKIKNLKLLNELESESDVWSIPDLGEDPVSVEKTNAMGLRRNWHYEPPEADEETELQPLTAEQIEEIRQAAYEEGLAQGKADGFAQGYEEGKTSGHETGLTEGRDTGLAEGLAQGQTQIAELAKKWQGMIDDLHQPMKKVEGNVEKQLLELLVQLVEAVTMQEAKTNPDILFSAISAGIKALPAQQTETQIYLNPLDVKLVEGQFGSDYIREKQWRLLPAPHIAVGSCQIENSTSNIDLTLKAKLKEVLDSFLQDALHH